MKGRGRYRKGVPVSSSIFSINVKPEIVLWGTVNHYRYRVRFLKVFSYTQKKQNPENWFWFKRVIKKSLKNKKSWMRIRILVTLSQLFGKMNWNFQLWSNGLTFLSFCCLIFGTLLLLAQSLFLTGNFSQKLLHQIMFCSTPWLLNMAWLR